MNISTESTSTLFHYLNIIPDPRINRRKKHRLIDILICSICAVLCGAENFCEIEFYSRNMEEWLRSKLGLTLEFGIPSHDTFRRVFAIMDPEAFRRVFIDWAKSISPIEEGEVISIDGKALRATRKEGKEHSAIYMISAWASEAGITLGQIKCDEKSNEIPAVPPLLDLLNIEGATVTLDAMGCQTETVNKIIEKKADYVISVKNNQKTLFKNIKAIFEKIDIRAYNVIRRSRYESSEKAHGRIESRQYCTLNEVEARKIGLLNTLGPWKDLNTITRVISRRKTVTGKETISTRFFISSLNQDAEALAKVIRCHWNVENQLHWRLDVSFAEDKSTIRNGYAAENFAGIRRLVLNLLKLDITKGSISSKRKLCGWKPEFALKVLLSGVVASI